MYIGILSNAALILIYIIFIVRDLNLRKRSFKRYRSEIN
jgi:hypothetical protein